jgi:hypothetical protein
MNDRYMVISPETLEAMRRAGHAAKLEVRIEKLEAALRDVLHWADHCLQCDYDDDWAKIEKRARKALEGKDD